nr:MAG TPA: hypothetical protein [Bacteriophage sp.]
MKEWLNRSEQGMTKHYFLFLIQIQKQNLI